MKSFFIKALFVAATLTLLSCSSDKDKNEKTLPADQLYNNGMSDIDQRNYKSAVESFQKIEQNYPFSQWATKGMIMAAYASYKKGDFDDAANMLDSYIKIHPGNPDVSYAYYLRALCYYDRIVDVERDQQITEEALQNLKEVVIRFPNSEYGRDAKIKLDLVVDHLAGKEMDIGRFYEKRKSYIAAINRFKTVIKKYQTTTHVPEALDRLVECYMALGVKDEAQKYAAVLRYNYPESKWYRYSYALFQDQPHDDQDSKSWFKGKFIF